MTIPPLIVLFNKSIKWIKDEDRKCIFISPNWRAIEEVLASPTEWYNILVQKINVGKDKEMIDTNNKKATYMTRYLTRYMVTLSWSY